MRRLITYLVASAGILADFITSKIGLSMGFIETHAQYSPVYAIVIFFSAITILMLTLPKTKFWRIGILALSCVSFLGAANNILVMLGIFRGLTL